MQSISSTLIAAALVVACAPGSSARTDPPANASPRTGTLRGTIVAGPTCPAESASEDCSPQPASGARLVFRELDGESVIRAVADERGEYSVALPAGRYRVELDAEGIESSKDLPAEVSVLSGRESRLDVRIDTGIR